MSERKLVFSASQDDFEITAQPRGGPGGQHRNKVSTGIRITHRATGLTAASFSEKSQLQNRKLAFRLLAARIVAHLDEERAAAVAAPAGDRLVVRTYHAVDNRVKDHHTGRQWSYRETVGEDDIDDLIDHRAEAMRDAERG